MKRLLLVALVAAVPAAAYWALKAPALDGFLTRKAPEWARAAGVDLRLTAADFDPWGPSLRVSGLEVRGAGGEWVLSADTAAVRLRFLKSLSGSLHLEAELASPRFVGEIRGDEGAGGEGKGGRGGLPSVVFERLRIAGGAAGVRVPAFDLSVALPSIEVDWVAARGTGRLAGGSVAWRGEVEPLEVLEFEGERRFAAVRVERLIARTRRLELEASGRIGPWRLLDLDVEAGISLRELPAAWLKAAKLERFAPVETEVSVTAKLGGSTAKPKARGSLSVAPGRFGRLRIDGAAAEWDASAEGLSFRSLEARTSAGGATDVQGRLTWGAGLALDARGRADGYDLRAFMALLLPGWFPVGVQASGSFQAKGPLAPELALECQVDLQARGLDVTVGEERDTVFALPAAGLVSRLTVGAHEIGFGPTRVETPSAVVAIPSGRLVYTEGLWFDTDIAIRDLEVVRRYVPPGFDARGAARGRFGGPYAELVFEYDLDLDRAVVLGQDLGTLRGRARYDLRDLRLEGVVLQGRAGRVEVGGTAGLRRDGEYALQASWEVPSLEALARLAEARGLPPLGDVEGRGWARGRVGGPLDDPFFQGEVGGTGVGAAGVRVDQAQARVRASAAGWTVEGGEAHAYGARVEAQGAGDRESFRAGGTLAGVRPEVLSRAWGRESPVQGTFGGTFRAAGPYKAPTGDAAGRLSGLVVAGHALGDVEVEVRYRDRVLEGEAKGFGGAVSARAELGLDGTLPLAADADLVAVPWTALPLTRLPEGLTGTGISARVQVGGNLGGDRPRVEVSWSGAAAGAAWNGVDLGEVDLGGHYGPGGVSFSAGLWEREVEARGLLSAAESAPLEVEVEVRGFRLTRLRPLAPLPAGKVTGRGRALLSVAELRAAAGAEKLSALAELEAEGAVTGLVVAGGVALPEWKFRATSPAGRPEVRVTSEGLTLEATLEDPVRARWSARVSLKDFVPTRLLPEEHRLYALEGSITAAGSARGEGNEVQYAEGEGVLDGLAWGPLRPSRWVWTAGWKQGRAWWQAEEPLGITVRGGWAPGQDLVAEVALKAVPLQGWVAHPRVPDDLAGEATGRGEFRAAEGGALSAWVELSRLHLAVPPLALDGDGPVRLSYADDRVRVERLRMVGDRLDLAASGGLRPGESWDLDVDATLGLDALHRWVKGVRRGSGTARAELELRGPWEAPRIAGPVQVEAGATLALEALDLPIEDLDASGFFDAEKGLIVEWVDAQVGRGRVHLEGGVGLEGLRPGRLRLLAEVRNIAEERPPQVSWLVDADLLVTGTADRPEVRGDLRLKEFLYERRVNLKTLVFDAIQRRPREVRGQPEAGTVFVDVSARGDNNLRVENNLADLSLAVDLRARGYLPRPVLWGRVEVREGTVRLRSQEYEALRSSVEFLGETQPVPLLDVHVRTNVRQYAISVDITGPLDDYQVSMGSLPALAQNDIVALLSVGSTAEEMQDTQAVTAAEAASFLTGRLQDELESGVGELLGFDQFHIDPAYSPSSQTTMPRVTVGKTITRALFARYSAAIGGETEQDLEVQYTLTPRVSLLGTWSDRGAESQGSLGGEVRFRFPFR